MNYLNTPRYDNGYRSVHFNLKQQKCKMKPSQIMLCVNINGCRIRVYTKKKVEPAFWDVSRECCKSSELLSPRVNKRMADLNSALTKIRQGLKVADMKAAEKGEYLTIDDLRSVVGRHARSTKQSRATPRPGSPVDILRRLVDSFDTELSSNGLNGTSTSKKTYLYHWQRLKDFVAETHYDLSDFSALDKTFYQAYLRWLTARKIVSSGKTTHYSASTICISLRAVCNLHRKAYQSGLTDVPEYKDCASICKSHATATKVYLTESDLAALMRHKPGSSKEKAILDMFILASFTGLRISDINRLNEAAVSDGVIRMFQQKTHGYVSIPVLKEIRDLVETYSKSPVGFPRINQGEANRTIKSICKEAGLVETVPVQEYRGGEVSVRNLPKYELVSFHTARRSCITNLFRRGYSPNYIMTMSGHKSISSFQRYIRSNEEELACDFIRELKKTNAV